MHFRHWIFYLIFSCSLCLGDYGWIPKYQSLWTKAGFEYLSSKENFGSDGERGDTTYQGSLVSFAEYKFLADVEYGIAHQWAAFMRFSILGASISPHTTAAATTTYPSSGGLGDLYLGTKWNLLPKPILLTLEVFGKIPPYSTQGLGTNDLAKGDGDVAVGFLTHTGYRAGKYGLFALSPGFLFRSNGYNAQLLLNGMAEVLYRPVFLRLFFEYRYGLNKTDPATVLTNNSHAGSGGSFARVSKNSDLFSVGLKAGYQFYKRFRFELNYQQSLTGNRAPHYWQLGVNLFASWDFFKPEKKIRVMEVPFETENAPVEPKED